MNSYRIEVTTVQDAQTKHYRVAIRVGSCIVEVSKPFVRFEDAAEWATQLVLEPRYCLGFRRLCEDRKVFEDDRLGIKVETQ